MLGDHLFAYFHESFLYLGVVLGGCGIGIDKTTGDRVREAQFLLVAEEVEASWDGCHCRDWGRLYDCLVLLTTGVSSDSKKIQDGRSREG
jgi:hypothetical protein